MKSTVLSHPVVSHVSTSAGSPVKVTEQNQTVYRTSNLSDQSERSKRYRSGVGWVSLMAEAARL